MDKLTDTVDQLIDRVTGLEGAEERAEREEEQLGRHTAARAEARSPTALPRQESRGSQKGYVDWRGESKTRLDYTDSLFNGATRRGCGQGKAGVFRASRKYPPKPERQFRTS